MKSGVFEYNDPVDFLNASLKSIQETNPQYSLRAWAKQLGLSNVAMLSLVLNRKRRLLPSLSSKISDQFVRQGRMSETEARYFDILVLFSNASSPQEKTFYESILSGLRPDGKFATLGLDQLRSVADWYHSAILEMTFLKDFSSDPRWISLRLGDDVNQGQVTEAIDRLIRLGLLERTKDGKLKKTSVHLATPTDIPSQSLKRYHAEMIQKAIRALEEQSTERRDITSYTLTTSLEKIPQAKRMIRDFRRKLAQYLETPGGDTVYQINMQLFDLLRGT